MLCNADSVIKHVTYIYPNASWIIYREQRRDNDIDSLSSNRIATSDTCVTEPLVCLSLRVFAVTGQLTAEHINGISSGLMSDKIGLNIKLRILSSYIGFIFQLIRKWTFLFYCLFYVGIMQSIMKILILWSSLDMKYSYTKIKENSRTYLLLF